jgi:hypothetical protein
VPHGTGGSVLCRVALAFRLRRRCRRRLHGLHERADLLARRGDEGRLLLPRQERALEAHDRQLAQLVPVEAQRLVRTQELVRHRRVRHEAVVGVQVDDEALVVEEAERVLLQAGRRVRLHVGREADLDGDAEVVDEPHELAVLPQARAVADPARIARVQCLVDGRRAECLAGMDGHRHVRVGGDLERRLVVDGRMPAFGAGEVERDDAPAPVRHGQLGHGNGDLHRQVAQAADDERGRNVVLRLGPAQAAQSGIHHLLRRQPATDVEFGAEADLHVADVLGGRVRRQLVGDALDGRRRLHQLQRDLEALQVVHEADAIGHLHPRAELGGAGDGQPHAGVGGELEHGGRPQ